MDNSDKISKVDHGVDVCGDEWDEPEEEPEMSSKIKWKRDTYQNIHIVQTGQ